MLKWNRTHEKCDMMEESQNSTSTLYDDEEEQENGFVFDREEEEDLWDDAAIVKTFHAALEYHDADEHSDENSSWMHRPLLTKKATEGGNNNDETMEVRSKTKIERKLKTKRKAVSWDNFQKQDGSTQEEDFYFQQQHQQWQHHNSSPPLYSSGDEDLTNLLQSWYNAGYHTGRYQARRELLNELQQAGIAYPLHYSSK